MNLTRILISLPAMLIAITIHEFSHGYTAHLLGDPTPRRQGRLTLNPLPHLDLLGALMLLVAGFGWAKPVEVNPFHFRGNRQRGLLLVSLAGPLSNVLVALLGAILYNLFGGFSAQTFASSYFTAFLTALISLNVYLALFNLLPVPPLDGSKILQGLLPPRYHEYIYQLEAYGPIVLILLIVTNITSIVLVPLAQGIILFLFTISRFITGGF